MSEDKIPALLKDMEHGDQDNREMAATDMCTEIVKGAKLDPGLEKAVCTAYIKQLEDVSINVRDNVVKCISKICSKVSEEQFGVIANKLTECVVKGSAEFRDVYATCLKTLIGEAGESFGATLCSALLDPLVNNTGHKMDEVTEQCIDLTNDLLKRFNVVLVHNPKMIKREVLMKNLINQLNSTNLSLKKKASACLGSLAVIMMPKQLSDVISLLLKKITPKSVAASQPFIETLGAVAETVGYKLAPNLSAIMDVLRPFCVVTEPSPVDHDIKEVCLAIYECSIRKCPKEVSPYLGDILNTALTLLEYDPNYNPDAMVEEAMGEDMNAWGEPEDVQQVAEDDYSWKVRRASAKLLMTIIKYRNDIVQPKYGKIIELIVSRLNERDETVKCDVLHIFTNMIKGMVMGQDQGAEGDVKAGEDMDMPALLVRKSSAESVLKDLPETIVKVLEHINDKSQVVREAIVNLIYTVTIADPDTMNGSLLGAVLPKLLSIYKESTSTIKILLLKTIRRLIRTSLSEDGYLPYLEQLVTVFNAANTDDYYKVPAEGLKTAGSLVRLLRRQSDSPNPAATKTINDIYTMCSKTFKVGDVDSEIKQGVIYAMGSIVAYASDILKEKEIDDILATLQERLKNDALTLHVMKAFHAILSCPKKLPIEKRLAALLEDFLLMTHKIARSVKLAGLNTLDAMCEKYPEFSKKSADIIVKDISKALKDTDYQAIQLALKILSNLSSHASDPTLEELLKAMLELCKSVVIDAVVEEATPIIQNIASRRKGKMSPEAISEVLSNNCTEKNIRSIASIIARIVTLKHEEAPKMLEYYTKTISTSTDPLRQKLAYMIIGNIGRKKDLEKFTDINNLLNKQLLSASEEMKINVAICLGNLAVGNKDYYLPEIMNKLKGEKKLGYLMLVALREVAALDNEGISKCKKDLLPILKVQANTDDEGNRTMIAEIVGKLLTIDPTGIKDEVIKNLKDKEANVRATYALSYKYWFGKGKIDLNEFRAAFPDLLELFKDNNVKVQAALLGTLIHIAHLSPITLRTYAIKIFAETIPLTIFQPKLVKVVDLGPLQHRIDEGEPVREGAYVLLDNMLEELNDKMELPKLADRLSFGLSDTSDEVQATSQQILMKLCHLSPGTILGLLGKFLQEITSAVEKLTKKLNKKQDVERATDNLRGYLKAFAAIDRIPEIDLNETFQDCKKKLMADPTVKSIFEELNKCID